jgi:hypothetical protein
MSTGAAAIFAVVALVLAGGMVALYLTRGSAVVRPKALDTPESAVREFLTAVFVAHDEARLAAVVCSSWPPNEAMDRTRGMVAASAHVSWDSLSVASTQTDRVTLTAHLGLRFPQEDEVHPASFQEWHFTVVNEDGWRVCDASAVVT